MPCKAAYSFDGTLKPPKCRCAERAAAKHNYIHSLPDNVIRSRHHRHRPDSADYAFRLLLAVRLVLPVTSTLFLPSANTPRCTCAASSNSTLPFMAASAFFRPAVTLPLVLPGIAASARSLASSFAAYRLACSAFSVGSQGT